MLRAAEWHKLAHTHYHEQHVMVPPKMKPTRAERAGVAAEIMPAASDEIVREALESFASTPLAPLALGGVAFFGVLTPLSAEPLAAPQRSR